MAAELRFRRVLLKLSGEMLRDGGSRSGIDPAATLAAAEAIRLAVDSGVEIALVIGAGNLFRGLGASRVGMDRTCADQIGMLGTVMNALAMRDALESLGVRATVQSAIAMTGIVEPFDQRQAVRRLDDGQVVLFAAGTGHPYFTTDTTAALRACEIHADAILKATKVNGVYSDDPVTNPGAVRYEHITFAQALARKLGVMDATAFSLCMENNMPIVVFNFNESGALLDILHGRMQAGSLVDNGEPAAS